MLVLVPGKKPQIQLVVLQISDVDNIEMYISFSTYL